MPCRRALLLALTVILVGAGPAVAAPVTGGASPVVGAATATEPEESANVEVPVGTTDERTAPAAAPVTDSGALARTGLAVLPLALIGFGLLLLGLVLREATRLPAARVERDAHPRAPDVARAVARLRLDPEAHRTAVLQCMHERPATSARHSEDKTRRAAAPRSQAA